MSIRYLVSVLLAMFFYMGFTTIAMADCSTQSEIPQAECEALVAFYNSTDGPNWTDNSGWTDTDHPCSFRGVQCYNGFVTGLNLSGNNLTGPIPPEFANLTSLDILNLNYNGLTSLPPEFGSMIHLSAVYLTSNELTTIPPELGNLNLFGLYLDRNNFTSPLPIEFWNIIVKHLNLSRTGLEIPPEIEGIRGLSTLYWKSNNLTSIPSEFFNLTGLESLNLGGNSLTSIPSELFNLTGLKSLYLYGNSLTSIPSEIANLTRLGILSFYSNNISEIPPEIGSLPNLYYSLDLHDNNISEIPSELYNLVNTERIDLRGNNLSGSIPPEFSNLTGLEDLDLSNNGFTGSIPLEFGNFANLRVLYLSSNQLTGAIPLEIGSLQYLRRLDLSNNNLTGSIPPELGNLEYLEVLYLGNNLLTGAIPPELGNLRNVEQFRLFNNNLSGSLPTELGNLRDLYNIQLFGNSLSDTVPFDVAQKVASLNYCNFENNDSSLCFPNTPAYQALGKDPLCGLPLSDTCPVNSDLDVFIDPSRDIVYSGQSLTFQIRIGNTSDSEIVDVPVEIVHGGTNFSQPFWGCSQEKSDNAICTHLSSSSTGASFSANIPAGGFITITGGGTIDTVPVVLAVTAMEAGATISRGMTPPDLPGTQETMLCSDSGRCTPGNIDFDDSKDTIILTHGLQREGCDRDDLWTGFETDPAQAGYLLNEKYNGDVNVLQFFWKGACQRHESIIWPFWTNKIPDDEAYIAGRKNVSYAGRQLARLLKQQTGDNYNEEVHFIGHSLGTAVSAYAAADFLDLVPDVQKVQVTLLDNPNNKRVSKIWEMSKEQANQWGFDKNFFASVLPDTLGSKLRVDNYYAAIEGKFDTKLGSAGVGDKINGPFYNHEALSDPHTIGPLFIDQCALNPNFRTTLLSGICIPKLVLKEDANERKKKGTFGQV